MGKNEFQTLSEAAKVEYLSHHIWCLVTLAKTSAGYKEKENILKTETGAKNETIKAAREVVFQRYKSHVLEHIRKNQSTAEIKHKARLVFKILRAQNLPKDR